MYCISVKVKRLYLHAYESPGQRRADDIGILFNTDQESSVFLFFFFCKHLVTLWRRKLATVTKCSLYVLQCSAGVRINESSDTDEHRNECAEMRGNFWSLCWCVGWHQTGEWSAEGIAEASSGAVLCLTKVSDIVGSNAVKGEADLFLEMAGNMNVRMKQTRMTGTTCNSFLFFNVCNLSS